MKTPEQIRDMEFQKGPMGGYKQSDVELFLEEVASQIEILTKQKNDAERKLQEMGKQAPEAALTATGIQNVLVSAQRVADQVVEDSKAEAERIIAEANLKLAEADIKARDVISEAEAKAVLLGETAETEAAKIIAAAVKEGETIVAEAKESIELEQKLYDRLKIEVSDFRKKASQQCSALVELINQLPGEIPFNMERSKQVLSVDFSNPDELLKTAVEERLAKEAAEAEAQLVAEAEVVAEPVIEPIVQAEPANEPAVEPEIEENEEPQLSLDVNSTVKFEVVEDEEDNEENIPFATAIEEEEPIIQKGHISFSDDDFDDDEDDEPRLFFRRKKK
ncbi:MAG: DivIVA domain-containing protein [Clostridia bacterium]|nr:DivIVA domain-containing protein [Clostridia bacterium]